MQAFLLFATPRHAQLAATAATGIVFEHNYVLKAEFARRNLVLNQQRAMQPQRTLSASVDIGMPPGGAMAHPYFASAGFPAMQGESAPLVGPASLRSAPRRAAGLANCVCLHAGV